MKKLQTAMLLAVIMILTIVPLAFAQQPVPIAGCPAGFELHSIGDHEMHHDHHVGLEFDVNGDTQICVKHLSSGLHVHTDNVVR